MQATLYFEFYPFHVILTLSVLRASFADNQPICYCQIHSLTYRSREFYDLIFFIKSVRGLVAFNILEHISFQTGAREQLTRNRMHGLNHSYTNSKLESSAHFYPLRIARLWMH